THLFGGSAGREGVALQMSGSLTDSASRVLHLGRAERSMMLIAALAGGFGAGVGVPLAGAVVAPEGQSIGPIPYAALVPARAASIVGDLTVRGLGYEHAPKPQLVAHLSFGLTGRIAIAGLAFGLAGVAFVELTDAIKRLMLRRVGWHPLRLVYGGAVV